jgi:hypothetical protein
MLLLLLHPHVLLSAAIAAAHFFCQHRLIHHQL